MPQRSASQWSVLLTFTDLMTVADAAFQRLPGFLDQPDQYRTTKIIATIRNAATSESARSSAFERVVAPGTSSGGMAQSPSLNYFRGLSSFRTINA
jgi:hypothetical protein